MLLLSVRINRIRHDTYAARLSPPRLLHPVIQLGLHPPSRNESAALAAPSLLDLVAHDAVTGALDQRVTARWTERILVRPYLTRSVARIDISQSRVVTDLCGADERFQRRRIGIGHLIVLMERRYMPRNVG